MVGNQTPISYKISDLTIYNLDITNLASLAYLVQNTILKKKTTNPKESFDTYLEQRLVDSLRVSLKNCCKNQDLEQFPKTHLKYVCQRKLCSFCVTNYYEENFNILKMQKNWLCHFCLGICNCTRCLR